MPFQSKAQERWMWANHPDMAKRWAKETPKGSLPERVGAPKDKGKHARTMSAYMSAKKK